MRSPSTVTKRTVKARVAAQRPSRSREAFESLLFEVVSSSPYYSFGLSPRPDDPDPYSEHPSWKIEARCLQPAGLAGRIAQFNILGDRRLTAEMRTRGAFAGGPHGVGLIDADKTRFAIYASLPLDALWAMGAALSSGAVRYVVTHGPRLARGKATIRYIRFEGADLDQSDWE